MRVVGFSGKAMHGKDTAAKLFRDIAREEYGVHFGSIALADALKSRVYGELGGAETFENVFDFKPEHIREKLQQVGTELGREVFGEEIWTLQTEATIRLLARRMDFLGGVTITDVRFPNEVEFVLQNGIANATMEREVSQLVNAEIDAKLVMPATVEYQVRLFKALWPVMQQRWLEKNGRGISLYILSDRPTLTGEAAQHKSETALDHLELFESFTGVIYNWTHTTLDDLKEQLRPYVELALN